MEYIHSVLIDKNSRSWTARCPAMEEFGARTGGKTKEEALTDLHSILLMILLDLEEKELTIPTDKIVPNGAKITINTGAANAFASDASAPMGRDQDERVSSCGHGDGSKASQSLVGHTVHDDLKTAAA